MTPDDVIGLTEEKARELLKNESLEIKDISRPDRFHENMQSTKRVIKAERRSSKVILFVAGFVDNIK